MTKVGTLSCLPLSVEPRTYNTEPQKRFFNDYCEVDKEVNE